MATSPVQGNRSLTNLSWVFENQLTQILNYHGILKTTRCQYRLSDDRGRTVWRQKSGTGDAYVKLFTQCKNPIVLFVGFPPLKPKKKPSPTHLTGHNCFLIIIRCLFRVKENLAIFSNTPAGQKSMNKVTNQALIWAFFIILFSCWIERGKIG